MKKIFTPFKVLYLINTLIPNLYIILQTFMKNIICYFLKQPKIFVTLQLKELKYNIAIRLCFNAATKPSVWGWSRPAGIQHTERQRSWNGQL